MSTVTRWSGHGRAVAAAAVLVGLGALLPAIARDVRAVPAQESARHYLPHLVSAGFSPTLAAGRPAARDVSASGGERARRPAGFFSFGESSIELANVSDRRASVTIDVESQMGFANVRLRGDVKAREAYTVALQAAAGITSSDYSAIVTADAEIGVVARSWWETGAMAVYEAPTASRSLLLPLFAVGVHSHTSVLQLTNTDRTRPADVHIDIAESAGGGDHEWTFRLDPGESNRIDPGYMAEFRGLPQIAGGGFLGGARISSNVPVAVMAYGDEAEGRGVSAVPAVPSTSAATELLLPLIRANVGGDSLIAILNPANQPVDVSITYRGSAASPSGAGRTFEHSFSIRPRHYAYVDLDVRRPRGSVPAPSLPRGSGRGRGFFGSAVIRASAPVAASVLEQDVGFDEAARQDIRASAAYNAFAPADLGTAFLVPRAFVAEGGRTTNLLLLNPGVQPVTMRATWRDPVAGGPASGSSGPVTIPAGDVVGYALTGGPGEATVEVLASGPVAALVFDVAGDGDFTAWRPPRTSGAAPPVTPATPTHTPTPSHTPRPGATTPVPTTAVPTTAVPGPTTPGPAPTTATPPSTVSPTPEPDGGRAYLPRVLRRR